MGLKHTFLLLLLISLLNPSIVLATEKAYEQHMAKGILSLETNNYSSAIEEFRAAMKEKPDDEKAILYLGIALSRSGNKDAETTLKKALSMNPQEPRTNLELGIYYYSKSLFEEAKDYLEEAVRLAPNTEVSSKAEEYLKAIANRAASRKPWMINISAGMQYDSNVVLEAENGPLPQGISRKSDWSAVLYIKGQYNLLRSEKINSSISYSLYQSLHSKLSDFNITQNLITLNASYKILPTLNLAGRYSFEYLLVGGHDYDYAHTLTPSLIISEGRGFSTVIEYQYRKERFMDTALFTDNSDRTGSNNLIGITQNIPVTTSIIARIGYSHDEDSTRQDYWDYKGDKGFIGIKLNMPYRILLDLYGEYYRKDYKGVNPISGTERKDTIHTYSASLTRALTDRYSITIGECYIRNNSNIGLYDYRRAITSLFLNARF